MKLKSFLALLAVLLVVGCSSDNFLGIDETNTATQQDPYIDFGSTARAITRAEGDAAAALLNNQFVVFGTKTAANGTASDIFDNYVVKYQKAQTGQTDTNEKGWEYVGINSKLGATQGAKIWDFSAQKYDFVAAAGLADDEKFTNTVDGIRINVADADAMTNIYVSDRVTATSSAQTATATTPATMAYATTVNLKFRRLGAQMRIGFYETIPGYAVKDLVFYYIGAPSGSKTVGVGGAFPLSGKYTVTYDDATNEAHTHFAGAGNNMSFLNTFGQIAYTSAESKAGIPGKEFINEKGEAVASAVNRFIGSSSSTATYAKGTYTIDGQAGILSDYKPILPNENNTLKMQLRLDYTLVALDGSKEEIHINDAYVSVPINYLQWKPNHTYTYLFKISDKSNGFTGDGGGGTPSDTGDGRDPDPDNGGGDNDPSDINGDGELDPPYIQVVPTIPDPDAPLIPDPDAPLVPDPDAPLVPDPSYPPIEDPENPGTYIPDPDAPLIPDPSYPLIPDPDAPLVPDPSYPEIPDPNYPPTIPDPDNPDGTIPNPDLPWVPNPDYLTGPDGDQGDPSNPVPTPQVPVDPSDPDGPTKDDPTNPAGLFPITFDAVVVEAIDANETIFTNVDGTDNSSNTEH